MVTCRSVALRALCVGIAVTFSGFVFLESGKAESTTTTTTTTTTSSSSSSSGAAIQEDSGKASPEARSSSPDQKPSNGAQAVGAENAEAGSSSGEGTGTEGSAPEEVENKASTEAGSGPEQNSTEPQVELEEFSKEEIPDKIKEAGIYNKKGMAKEAIALCDRILAMEPDNMQALAVRGCAYVTARKFQEGLNDLNRVLETQKTGTHLVFGQRAMANLQMEEYDKAIADSDIAIKLQPKNQQYFIVRALAYHRSNNYQKALEDFDDGIALDPEGPNLHLFLSLRSDTYMALKRYGDAQRDLSKVVKLAPKDPQSWMNRAAFYIRTKDWEKAAADLDNVIDFAPMGKLSNQALILRAEARLKSAQYKESIDDYSSLLVGYPKESAFLAGRAEAQLALGNYSAALKDMDKLLKYNPYESKYFELRARVHEAMKNTVEADSDRKRAKELAAEE